MPIRHLSLTLFSFVPGRLITALGSASGLACTFMLMHDLLKKNEYKRAMPYTILSFTLGIGSAVLLGGIVSEYFNWSICFWILLFHGIVMFFSTFTFKHRHEQLIDINPLLILKHYGKALRNTRLIIFSLVIGLMSAFSYIYSAIAPLYANQFLHQTSSQYGYWNLINMAGMLVGGLLAASIMKISGPKTLLTTGLIGFTPCCLSLLILSISDSNSVLWFYITTMFMYVFGSFLFPAGSYFTLQSIQDKANGSSMMSFINMLSAIISVIIVGYLPISIISSFAIVITSFLVLVGILMLSI